MMCDRCGEEREDVRDGYVFTNCFGEKVRMKLCWDCDFEVANGGDPFADESEVLLDRWEEAYSYDPINTPPIKLKKVSEL